VAPEGSPNGSRRHPEWLPTALRETSIRRPRHHPGVLHIHRSPRADALADALAEILAVPAEDPFAPEVVSVPTRGMERWLAQRMARRLGTREGARDGVCANVEFPFPARLVSDALAAAYELDPSAEPWRGERLVWPLLEVIDACATEPWMAPLSAHLGAAQRQPNGPRFARVRRIAALYAHYDLRRGEMLRAWAAGADTDAVGGPLPAGSAWQPELWRRLRGAVGVPCLAERTEQACERLRRSPECVSLPPRLAVFGLTALPGSHLDVLEALAAAREVHLFVLHPSPALWRRVHELSASAKPSRYRAEDRTANAARNRLLASWGHDSRELQLVLERLATAPAEHEHPIAKDAPQTLLAAIQTDVRADRAAPGRPASGAPDRRMALGADDLSVQVHACHGPARQVQVLREAILHALADDATLEPRDVIVMCPDIETFAPLITATFGTAGPLDAPGWTLDMPVPPRPRPDALRVRLADRSLRFTNPLLAVLDALLELGCSRLTASELLDFADAEPVRRRFGFDDDELAQVRDWVQAAEIHWGLDAANREPYGLGHLLPGTWVAGVQRILLAVALGTAGVPLYGGVLPIDELDSSLTDLAGRLAELINRLTVAIESLRGPQTLERWATAAGEAVDMLAASGERDAWQRNELARLLDDVMAEAAGVAASARLSLADVRALLADRLAGRPTRANFRTGELTVCTLFPMRSVPHRVVCLLGLDDGTFPRRSPRDGDDVLLGHPLIGDRDPRLEDRQMLLDALLAAREQLIVTYTGNDERTNAQLPPAVVVGELLDAIDDTARVDGERASEGVVIHHPLQPFDGANFAAGRLRVGSPWGFDSVALEGALAMRGERVTPPSLIEAPLPQALETSVALEDLVRFVQRPVRAFLGQRLGISVWAGGDEVSDELPVALDALDLWGVGSRLLDGVLAGAEVKAVVQAEIARGALPPGALGKPVLDRIWPEVDRIAQVARRFGGEQSVRSVHVNAVLPSLAMLIGTVSGVRGTMLMSATYSRLSPRHRLASWVRLLALSAAHPQERFEAVAIGRGEAESDLEVCIARVPMLAADPRARQRLALTLLTDLVDLRARGLREPLPLPCDTAAVYARAVIGGVDEDDALDRAQKRWKTQRAAPGQLAHRGECEDPEHLLAFGEEHPFAALLAVTPHADESGEGWAAQPQSRFGRLARRLWDPLLERERLEAA